MYRHHSSSRQYSIESTENLQSFTVFYSCKQNATIINKLNAHFHTVLFNFVFSGNERLCFIKYHSSLTISINAFVRQPKSKCFNFKLARFVVQQVVLNINLRPCTELKIQPGFCVSAKFCSLTIDISLI
jgi:hypothetical protein